MGDISGIAILFQRAINYILSGDQIYEGTCERLWKSQLAVGFDRDVSFGEIFSWRLHIYHFHQLLSSKPAGQFEV